MTFPDGIVDALGPQRLRLLVELSRRGPISAAADACRMGQPSASKHLRTLEAVTGEQLVERDGRASHLTPAGEVVPVHAQRVLDTLDGVLAEPFLDDEVIGIAPPGRLSLSDGVAIQPARRWELDSNEGSSDP